MDVHEIADRVEIPSVLTRYCAGLDAPGRDFSHWELAFTSDAVFVNWNGPGSELSASEMREFLTADDPVFSSQHLLSNILITRLDGDLARTTSEYLHLGVHRTESGDTARWIFKGGSYDDDLRRTEQGWRIFRHTIHRRWDKYETIPWPPANTTWARTVMAPGSALPQPEAAR